MRSIATKMNSDDFKVCIVIWMNEYKDEPISEAVPKIASDIGLSIKRTIPIEDIRANMSILEMLSDPLEGDIERLLSEASMSADALKIDIGEYFVSE